MDIIIIPLLFWAVTIFQGVQFHGAAAESTENAEQSVSPGRMQQYRHGDILIACALGLHESLNDGRCGAKDYSGVEAVETVNMVIDQINADDSILRGVTLGTLMVDTCSSPKHAVEMIISNVLPLVSRLNSTNYVFPRDHSKEILAGVIGAAYSSVSMQIANLLQVFSVPQISHWSTSHKLSDKKGYPYFFRTLPSSVHEGDAVLALVEQMGWNYIFVIYQDDVYGQQAHAIIKENAAKGTVCIASSYSLQKHPSDERLTGVCQDLLSNRKAKVAVLLASTISVDKLLTRCHSMSPRDNSIIWIGTEWASYLSKSGESYLPSLAGAIAFSPETFHLPSVDEYMTNIPLKQRQGLQSAVDPWFADYIAWKNNCRLSKSNPTDNKRVCSDAERLDAGRFRTHESLHNLGNAVLAFAHALDAYHRDVCGGQAGLCRIMADMAGTNKLAKGLLGYLKNVTFPAMNEGTFRFDDKHDGPPIYDIFTYGEDAPHGSISLRNGWTYAGRYLPEGSATPGITWKRGAPPQKASKTVSTCSQACEIGEAAIIADSQICCWHCQPCPEFQYVSMNSSACETCTGGTVPNSTLDGCEPLAVRGMEGIYSRLSLILGGFGVSLTVAVSGIIFKHRNTPLIRDYGKEMSFFVLFGVFLTFLECFVITVPASVVSCAVSRFVVAVGPAFMYAGMLVRAAVVSTMFNGENTVFNRVGFLLIPRLQTLVAAFTVLVQVFIAVVWCAAAAPGSVISYPSRETAFYFCANLVSGQIFIALAYPFLLITACTIFAVANRKIPCEFKEPLGLGITMHTICLIWIVFVAIFFSNSANVPAKLITISLCLAASAATVLFCLFIPKCYVVLFRPEGNVLRWGACSSSEVSKRGALLESIGGDATSCGSSMPGSGGEIDPAAPVHYQPLPS